MPSSKLLTGLAALVLPALVLLTPPTAAREVLASGPEPASIFFSVDTVLPPGGILSVACELDGLGEWHEMMFATVAGQTLGSASLSLYAGGLPVAGGGRTGDTTLSPRIGHVPLEPFGYLVELHIGPVTQTSDVTLAWAEFGPSGTCDATDHTGAVPLTHHPLDQALLGRVQDFGGGTGAGAHAAVTGVGVSTGQHLDLSHTGFLVGALLYDQPGGIAGPAAGRATGPGGTAPRGLFGPDIVSQNTAGTWRFEIEGTNVSPFASTPLWVMRLPKLDPLPWVLA